MTDPDTSESIREIPSDVADEMVRRLFVDGSPGPTERILFPGLGHGALVSAIERYCDRRTVDFPESVALETNKELVEQVRDQFESLPLEVLRIDFLGELPDVGQFDYIISDPPVVRLDDVPSGYREDLANRFETISTDGAGRDEDLYLAFFEQGLRLLAPEGRLVFLTPDFTTKRGQSAIPELKRRLTTFHIEDIDEHPVAAVYDAVDQDVVITTVEHVEPDAALASSVDFRGVQETLTTPYNIDIQDIMTQDPMSFYPTDDTHSVFLALVKNDYDAAPVRNRDTGDCIGLVSRADLTGADTGPLSDGVIESIDNSLLLPVTASFEEALDRLQSHRFCLVGTPSDVRGIVTRFDLNSIEVYFHLYATFARFEIGLRNAIRDYSLDWGDALVDGGVSQKRVRKLEATYDDNPAMAQDVLDTLLLSDLIKIIEHSRVADAVGFDQIGGDRLFSDINDLRGAVAHYQPLIHTLDTISFTGQRTVGDFGDIYLGLDSALENLEVNGYV